MTTSLHGGHVFIAASFPSGERAERWPTCDASAVAEAVTAAVRTIIGMDGKVLFGGHPTITPLVLMVAREHGVQGRVDVYQSGWFADKITDATRRLEQTGAGTIHIVPSESTRDASLETMRAAMLSQRGIRGGLFVGGMEGIVDEYEQFVAANPDAPRLVVAGPGGAAATLTTDPAVPTEVRELLSSSRQYPYVLAEALRAVADS